VLIVAGGAVSIDAARLAQFRPLLTAALADFHGTVIAGGTGVGVPGCVGDIVEELNLLDAEDFARNATTRSMTRRKNGSTT
jgi:hypothetical protein